MEGSIHGDHMTNGLLGTRRTITMQHVPANHLEGLKGTNSNWEYRDLANAYQARLNRGKLKDPIGTRFIHWMYKNIGKNMIFGMEPDKAHDFTVSNCHRISGITPFMGLLHDVTDNDNTCMNTIAMGLEYGNPFGLAAGMDKKGQLLTILDAAGFGFCSYGSMTAKPCEGNPKPWYHRYPEYTSLGVHAGIPNDGCDTVLQSADSMPTPYHAVRHASIAFTNTSYTGTNAMIEDFLVGIQKTMDSQADVCEINISCPNLMAGKPFKDPKLVDELFTEVDKICGTPARKEHLVEHTALPNGMEAAPKHRKPVLVKMPNATREELDALASVLNGHDVQGLALCNLLEEKDEYPAAINEPGGLSGKPCGKPALEAVRFIREHYGPRFAIEGVGGVMTPMDALTMMDAGADLVGFVTTLMYNGPQMASEFKTAYQGAMESLTINQ